MLDTVNHVDVESPVMTQKVGRPKSKRAMQSVIFVRVPELMRQRVLAAAEADDRTLGQWMRQAINEKLGRRR